MCVVCALCVLLCLLCHYADGSQIHISVFALLFAELVRYSQARASSIAVLEEKYVYFFGQASCLTVFKLEFSISVDVKHARGREAFGRKARGRLLTRTIRLSTLGERVGVRIAELLSFKEKNSKRENKLNNVLVFIQTSVWKVNVLCLQGFKH